MEIKQIGTKILINDMYEFYPAKEGEINIVYGRIGQGKTTKGTRNVLKSLNSGLIVYTNWRIKWDGYDERKILWCKLLGVLGLKKQFAYFPKSNLHYWNFAKKEIDDIKCFDFVDQLSRLTDADIHLDEGHIPFDSYEGTKMDENKRTAVFAMRHYNRSLTVYTQRANSVHVNLRGNTNRFFKCEKLSDFRVPFMKRRFVHFKVTEFQDLSSSNTVDETRVLDDDMKETDEYKYAVSTEYYWGSKKLFSRFDSKYLRDGMPTSQKHNGELYLLTWYQSLKNVINKL